MNTRPLWIQLTALFLSAQMATAMPLWVAASSYVISSGHATAPTFVGVASADAETATTPTITTSISSGDTVIVAVSLFLTGGTVTGISGGGTYSRLSSKVNAEDSRIVTEVWGVLSASSASSVVVTLSGASNVSVSVVRYTGVSAFGNVGTSGNASGVYGTTTQTISLTMQDINNRIVHVGTARSPLVGTATVGTMRESGAGSYGNQASVNTLVGDNTSATTGALAMTYTTSGCLWNAVAVELRSNP